MLPILFASFSIDDYFIYLISKGCGAQEPEQPEHTSFPETKAEDGKGDEDIEGDRDRDGDRNRGRGRAIDRRR